MISAHDKMIAAVLEFCRYDASINASRRALKRCEVYYRGGASYSDPPEPACDWTDPKSRAEETVCGACMARYDGRKNYVDALRKRSAAKSRMTKWAARYLAAPQEIRQQSESGPEPAA